jgi:folate-binding protein YgfZ
LVKAVVLDDRAAIRVAGPDATHFLHNLITSSVEALAPGAASYGALLTPQGKIISDFLALAADDGYLLDVPAPRVDDLRKRLTLYKLRARVTLTTEDSVIAVIFETSNRPSLANVYADPRLPELGFRAFLPPETGPEALAEAGLKVVSEDEYHAHRIALGVPEGGRDFAFDDAFPHEADMDQFGGVDFRKGCYIGQEIVSRMQHRGTARTRIVPVLISGPAVEGTEIMAGGKTIGTLGSVAGGRGLALIRIDRVDDAVADGEPLRAGDAVLTLEKPHWAQFRFPGEPLPEAAS